MNWFCKFNSKILSAFYQTSCAILLMALLFVPVFPKKGVREENYFTVYLNGIMVGRTESVQAARDLLSTARRQVEGKNGGIFYARAQLQLEGHSVMFGKLDDREDMIAQMEAILLEQEVKVHEPAYTVKIKDYMVNLAGSREVKELLGTILEPYDKNGDFAVRLKMDPQRELNVLTAEVVKQEELVNDRVLTPEGAGVELYFADIYREIREDVAGKAFADLDYGLLALEFADTVEVVECWLPADRITSLDDAVAQLTADREQEQIYVVKQGDTLLQIAEEQGIELAELLAINEGLESEETILRIGDEIRITVGEPILSVYRTERVLLEGHYEAEVEYVDNDTMYTTQQTVLQQPSAGIRKAAALVTCRNNEVLGEIIEKEDIRIAAVAKIVERGTKIPPTFIKPITGGRMTSNYGGRSAPVKGASTNHKGTDWSVPVGTAVMASSGGTVTKAGWASGYGYVVYISHEGGRETRYGHLSKVLVKAGQKVKQGEKIALSGNTGRSSGPHLHFELRINGEAVNSLNYLE